MTKGVKKVGEMTPAEREVWERRGRPTVLVGCGAVRDDVVRSRDGRTVYVNDDGTLRKPTIVGQLARRPGESARAFRKRAKEARRVK